MELTLKQENPEDIGFRNYWQHFNDFLMLYILLVMTLINLLVFWRYKYCNFDRPCVFVVIAFNFGYLDDAVLSTFSLMEFLPDFNDKNVVKASIKLVSSITNSVVFASLFLFAAELHRVRHIVCSEDVQQYSIQQAINKRTSKILVLCTALLAHLIIPIGQFFKDKELSFVLFLTAACLITFINTLLFVQLITGIKFFMKQWSPGFIFIFSIIGLEWAESYIQVYFYLTTSYKLYLKEQISLSPLQIVRENLIHPLTETLIFICFTSVLIYQCKLQIVHQISSPAQKGRQAQVVDFYPSINEDEDSRTSEDFTRGRFESTDYLMVVGSSERGLSINSSDEGKLERKSSRLDILLNPKFENFDRFLRSLLEVSQ